MGFFLITSNVKYTIFSAIVKNEQKKVIINLLNKKKYVFLHVYCCKM